MSKKKGNAEGAAVAAGDTDPSLVDAVIGQAPPTPEEEQAAFESGFSGEPVEVKAEKEGGDDPDPVKGEGQEGVDEEGAGEPAGEDPGEGVAAAKSEPDLDVAAQLKQINDSIRRLDGRYGSINSRVDNLIKTSKDAAPAGESPSGQQIKDALKDGDKMGALREQYPDWAEAFDESLEAMGSHIMQKIPRAEALAEEVVEIVTMNIQRPGWKQEINSPEFVEWFQKQDEETRALAESKSSADALALLEKWDQNVANAADGKALSPSEDGGEKQNQRANAAAQRLRAAVSPTKGAGGRPTAESEQQAFERAFNS